MFISPSGRQLYRKDLFFWADRSCWPTKCRRLKTNAGTAPASGDKNPAGTPQQAERVEARRTRNKEESGMVMGMMVKREAVTVDGETIGGEGAVADYERKQFAGKTKSC